MDVQDGARILNSGNGSFAHAHIVRLGPEHIEQLLEAGEDDVFVQFPAEGSSGGTNAGTPRGPDAVGHVFIADKTYSFDYAAAQNEYLYHVAAHGSQLRRAYTVQQRLTVTRQLTDATGRKVKNSAEILAQKERRVQELERKSTSPLATHSRHSSLNESVRAMSPASIKSPLRSANAGGSGSSSSRRGVLDASLVPRIMQILATGAMREADIVDRVKASKQAVVKVLESIAVKTGEEWALKHKPAERRTHSRQASADEANGGPRDEHHDTNSAPSGTKPARASASPRPKPVAAVSPKAKSTVHTSPGAKADSDLSPHTKAHTNPRPAPEPEQKPRVPSHEPHTERETKRAKVASEPSTAEMSKLAAKFQSSYEEYTRMYKKLQSTPRGSAEREAARQKYLEMHKQMQIWKRRLWDADAKKQHNG